MKERSIDRENSADFINLKVYQIEYDFESYGQKRWMILDRQKCITQPGGKLNSREKKCCASLRQPGSRRVSSFPAQVLETFRLCRWHAQIVVVVQFYLGLTVWICISPPNLYNLRVYGNLSQFLFKN